MPTKPNACYAAQVHMQAALAEAWHVDGYFHEAIAGWEALVLAGYERAESALKAAISCFSVAEYAKGMHWLCIAEAEGASMEEIHYVRAQAFWQQGQMCEAIEAFQQAECADPHLGKASNALGALYWQLGWTEKAQQQFTQALQRDPQDGEALVNTASLSLRTTLPEGEHEHILRGACALLAQAALLQPQHANAFVWHARLLRHRQAEQAAREALGKARLRGRLRGPVSHIQQNTHTGMRGQVQVCGELSPTQTQLTLRYTCPDCTDLPVYLAVNTGYHVVETDGSSLISVSEEEVRQCLAQVPKATNITYYRIPTHAWQHETSSASLRVTLVGQPIPPCVTLSNAEIELDGQAGWLPQLLPPLSLHWQIDIQLPPDFKLFLSTNETEAEVPGLIALRTPILQPLNTLDAKVPREITGIARADSSLLRLAPLLVERTCVLWEERVGMLHHTYPDVIVVDQPTSLFCYTRRNYMRLPSGLARRLERAAQVYHEAGHLWWGQDVRFVPTDAWLGEALAEYSLHMVEDAGWLVGYRQQTLALLRSLHDGSLPTQGLAKLHESQGRHAAYIVRARGGFIIAMLRTLMGDDAFGNFLRSLHELGPVQCFDAYHFFALASHWHGSSLNWFANQWIYTDTGMAFSVEDSQLTRRANVFHLSFTVVSRGMAIPGGPVAVAIQREGGAEMRVSVNLNLGSAVVTVALPTRPERIIVDPDLRWYAEQGSFTISGEDVYESARPSNLAHCSRNY